MDNATKSSLFHVALLLVVARGYMFSSTTPAGKCMNHVSQASGPGRKGSLFGDDIAKDDVVHDSRKGILLRLAPSIKHIQRILQLIVVIEISTRLFSILDPGSPVLSAFCQPGMQKEYTLGTEPIWPMFLIASTVTLGAIIRRRCFDALGKNFTFAHITREDHSLVTWGPYAYARHASYTGLAMTHIGTISALWVRGSWLSECGAVAALTGGKDLSVVILGMAMLVILFSAWNTVVTFALMVRSSEEDKTLKAKFGDEWIVYRQRVPWKFVPYIL